MVIDTSGSTGRVTLTGLTDGEVAGALPPPVP
jgi:hypothetical protein